MTKKIWKYKKRQKQVGIEGVSDLVNNSGVKRSVYVSILKCCCFLLTHGVERGNLFI